MGELVPPHGGGGLNARLLPAEVRGAAKGRAKDLRAIPMSSREVSDVLMLAMGAYTPLDGFMSEADWRGAVNDMKLASGLFWPIPITLSCAPELAEQISIGDEVALADGESGDVLALMRVEEKYQPDRQLECQKVYGTSDRDHPGVDNVLKQPQYNLAGPVECLSEGKYGETYPGLYLRPEESRALFIAKGWRRVSAFQTRNPMHRSHEYLAKIAVEVTDGVFVHQVLGKLKPGDIPADVRTEAIQAMIDHYFVPDTVVQAGYPIEMRYAGPREALLHALIRAKFRLFAFDRRPPTMPASATITVPSTRMISSTSFGPAPSLPSH